MTHLGEVSSRNLPHGRPGLDTRFNRARAVLYYNGSRGVAPASLALGVFKICSDLLRFVKICSDLLRFVKILSDCLKKS